MKKEGSSDYYPPVEESVPLNQQAAPASGHYGTFQGNPAYPQTLPPGFPYPVHPSEHYRGGTVQGYPVVEGTPEQTEGQGRLPCCGIGLGWFLFFIGWIFASIPWYVGVILLVCTKHDHRERVGLVCCTIAAVLSLIAIIVGGTSASS